MAEVAEKQEEVSPEEKLLNVIKNKPSDDTGNNKKSDNPEEVGVKKEKKKEKESEQKLKLVSQESGKSDDDGAVESSEEQQEESAAADAGHSKKGLIGASAAIPEPQAKGGKAIAFNVSTFNRALGVAVVIVMGLIGYEVWANISRVIAAGEDGNEVGVADDVSLVSVIEEKTPQEGLPQLQDILNSFEQKPMLRVFKKKQVDESGNDETTEIIKVVRGRFEKYAGQNLDLIALSRLDNGAIEAMVVDKKNSKTYFLQQEKSVAIGEWTVKVKGIQADRIIFEVDGKQVTVQ